MDNVVCVCVCVCVVSHAFMKRRHRRMSIAARLRAQHRRQRLVTSDAALDNDDAAAVSSASGLLLSHIYTRSHVINTAKRC